MDSPGTMCNNYTTFPPGTTDEEIFDMLFEGELKCLCSCGMLNTSIPPEPIEFICKGCGKNVIVATMNPEYNVENKSEN